MILFDENDIVDIDSLTEDEDKAFILFLQSEERRHAKDIRYIADRIALVRAKFGVLK